MIAALFIALSWQATPAPAWQARSLSHGGAARTWHEMVPAACAARNAPIPERARFGLFRM